ncbi:short chain dehydrogenase/ reductase [Microthyrium microscopicum]|uniref:Short chain dehydrogenase/ reductase n=1 Tax=Microthyrium microscopicum TaxID=703497 RepID=A0A6A6UNN3_9PEZI|nr:short chain dehydrogenase/ reductase [Microthyrium microscopicum]
MPSNTVYVITGANRGIGQGLVETYLRRHASTVVAVVRSDSASTSLWAAAENFTRGTDSILHIIVANFSQPLSPQAGIDTFKAATAGLDHIDILICSAGHNPRMCPTIEVTAEELRESFEINTILPLTTFQALWPLMKGSTATAGPKFIVLSSSMGSIGEMEQFPAGAYGPSKTAINYIIKSLHMQMAQNGLIAVALHPGWVQTDMGHFAAQEWGHEAGPPLTPKESVAGILRIIDDATRETCSGKFIGHNGEEIGW